MLKTAFLLACLVVLQASAFGDSARSCVEPVAAGPPVSLLIVTGGHPYEPSEFFATFAAMPNVRYQHYWLDGTRRFSIPEGGLGQYDVILFFDFQPGEITSEWRELLNRGRGFLFLHHAIGSFTQSPEFKIIAGGHGNFRKDRIAGVPNSTFHGNVRQRFVIKDTAHPVTCGIADFDMVDEAYDNLDVDPAVHVLMTSEFPKLTPAAGWTWSYQNKRVLYLQPGHGSLGLPPDHGPSSYQNESFKKLLARGIQWTAGRL